MQVLEISIHNALDMVMEVVALGPSAIDTTRAKDDIDSARAKDQPKFGWCRIE